MAKIQNEAIKIITAMINEANTLKNKWDNG